MKLWGLPSIHFIVSFADIAQLGQMQGCHCCDVQNVSKCSSGWSFSLCIVLHCLLVVQCITLSISISRSHGLSPQFGVIGEVHCELLMTYRKGSNLYLLETAVSQSWCLATEDALLTLCSLAESVLSAWASKAYIPGYRLLRAAGWHSAFPSV